MSVIYVLALENNRFYVGRTTDLSRRIQEHKDGKASAWTAKHKLVKLLECFTGDNLMEDMLVKKYMMKYGIENVRGGSYSKIKLSEDDMKYLEREIRGAKDLCFRCGRKGHFLLVTLKPI